MARCNRDRSLASSDDCDLCDNQRSRMAGLFDRTGGTMPEDRCRLRADHDYGLRYRTALWTQRSRIRLLGGDDVVGHSTYSVVCTRYSDFLPGHSAGGESATGLRRLGWSARLWSAASLRPIRSSVAPACSREWCTFRYVLRGARICRRTEIVVPGHPQGMEGSIFASRPDNDLSIPA